MNVTLTEIEAEILRNNKLDCNRSWWDRQLWELGNTMAFGCDLRRSRRWNDERGLTPWRKLGHDHQRSTGTATEKENQNDAFQPHRVILYENGLYKAKHKHQILEKAQKNCKQNKWNAKYCIRRDRCHPEEEQLYDMAPQEKNKHFFIYIDR